MNSLDCLYVNAENVTYFDSFGVEHIPKLESQKNSFKQKHIKTNIYGKEAYDSIMCGYFCTGFVAFMLKNKKTKVYQSMQIYFLLMNIKNDKTILKYFQQNLNKLY